MSERMSSISVKSLSDYPVLDMQGEPLGSIDDVMLDGTLGQTRFFILASGGGGLLGGPKTRYAVPASAVRLDTESEALVVDVPHERFRDARAFDGDTSGRERSDVFRL